jgi:hypothetical protein
MSAFCRTGGRRWPGAVACGDSEAGLSRCGNYSGAARCVWLAACAASYPPPRSKTCCRRRSSRYSAARAATGRAPPAAGSGDRPEAGGAVAAPTRAGRAAPARPGRHRWTASGRPGRGRPPPGPSWPVRSARSGQQGHGAGDVAADVRRGQDGGRADWDRPERRGPERENRSFRSP